MKTTILTCTAVLTLFIMPAPLSAEPAQLTLCTGSKSGVYFQTGTKMSKAITDPSALQINVKSTNGSWYNIREVAKDNGQCNAAIVQADAYALLQKRDGEKVSKIDRVGSLHDEYVHLICNGDLKGSDESILESGAKGSRKLAIGKPGSGAWVTWQNIIAEDDDYKETTVPVLVGKMRAAAKVADGAEADCLLYVAGLNSSYLSKVNARYGKKLRLRDFDDADFNDAVDPKGNRLYEFDHIDDAIYEDGMQSGNISDTDTIRMKAILVVNTDWSDENEDAFDALVDAMSMVQ